MTLLQTRRLNALMDVVSEHAFTPVFIPRLVDAAANATRSLGGSMWRVDSESRLDDVDHSTLPAGPGIDAYKREYSHLNPILPRAMAAMRAGDVAAGDEFFPVDEYRKTLFYNECVRRQGYLHELGALLEARPGQSAMLFVARAPHASPFGADEREVLSLAVPVIRAALAIRRRADGSTHASVARATLATRGWAALDVRASVLLMEGPLPDALRSAGNLVIRGRAIIWSDRSIHSRFEAALRTALAYPTIGPRTLHIHVPTLAIDLEIVPLVDSRMLGVLGASVALLFRETTDVTRRLANRMATAYSLTHQETIVAGRLARGESTRSIALSLGISYETVRSHAKRVYSKVGVRGRAQFSGHVLQLLAEDG